MSIDNCQVCDKRLDTDFVEYQDDGTLLCDGCLDEVENEQESDKVYVKTDDPCPEYLTAGKLYEVIGATNKKGEPGIGRIMDDYGVEIVALIGLPTSHLYGGMWTLCDQHGDPLAEQDSPVAERQPAITWCEALSIATKLSNEKVCGDATDYRALAEAEYAELVAERDRYKALAGELAEAAKLAESALAFIYGGEPLDPSGAIAAMRAALAKYKQEQEKGA
jgi:hypothetical protein